MVAQGDTTKSDAFVNQMGKERPNPKARRQAKAVPAVRRSKDLTAPNLAI
jgi:hypothetical protein